MVTSADLTALLRPRSIAIVGASPEEKSTGTKIMRFLDCYGYSGDIYPVNPNHSEIAGRRCYPSLTALGPVDLALIMVPAARAPAVIEDAVAAGLKCAVIMAAGFADDAAEQGHELQRLIERTIEGSQLRVLGPNCEGFLNVLDGIPGSFSSSVNPDMLLPALDWLAPDSSFAEAMRGGVAIVAQSGGLGFSLLSRGLRDCIGFSHVVSTGNEIDLDVLDCADFLLDDSRVKVLGMYIEGLKEPARFHAVARKAASVGKPLVIAKAGASEAARKAALSHTGHLAGMDAAYEAVFKRYGVQRVHDQDELLDLASAFSKCQRPTGDRVAVASWSGGSAVWMADTCDRFGFVLPEIDQERQKRLREVVPSFASTGNPIDITGASTVGLAEILDILVDAPYIDAVVLISTLHRTELMRQDFEKLRDVMATLEKPVLIYSYTIPSLESKHLLHQLRIPFYTSSTRCMRALRGLRDYEQFQNQVSSIPVPLPQPPVDLSTTTATLCEYEVKARLREAGVPVTAERLARSEAEAASFAEQLGFPVALKIQSPDIPHKAAAGGVRLGIGSPEETREAFANVMAAAQRSQPSSDLHGVLVQEMAGPGFELIVGIHNTSGFGPLVLLGVGGSHAERMRDTSLRCAPVTRQEASAMLEELRAGPLLMDGQWDVEALVDFVVRLSEWAIENQAAVTELDINPLLLRGSGQGVVVVDALMVVRDA